MSVSAARIGQPDPETAWEAVLGRNRGYDGAFVYAVRSTGVYCRPSCPSRRPARRHVTFFATPDAAERAGYRACRRCRPQESGPIGAERRVRVAARYLAAHLDERVTLARLARLFGMSPFHLQRIFKRVMGLTPKEFVNARRVERFKTHLRRGETVTTATYEAGYGSGSRVYEQLPARLGMTPGAYRAGGRGMRIHYTIVRSPLGRLLVGATERGVCAVSLGDEDAALERALCEEYPNAAIERGNGALDRWVASVLRLVQGEGPGRAVPIDVPATAFQWRVWKALQQIPRGRTRSYSQVARAVGQPTAVRAVARACATNPVALIVPCHRVVRQDGDLGGYRWGLQRKRRLLENEGATSASE